MMCLFLRYMTMINLLILTFRHFSLFLVKVTRELYSFFMIYFQNGVLSITHALIGCDTTSKVVTKNKKLLHKEKICMKPVILHLKKMKLMKI